MAPARPVICAIEDSAESRHAARAATWLARALGSDLLVAHVFDPLGIPAHPRDDMVARGLTDDDLERAARRDAMQLLAATAQATGPAAATAFREGQAVPELRRLADERQARLLVTGTAARGGLDRVLTGSVSSELAAAAPCPVVAVPRGAVLEERGPVVAGIDGSEHGLRAARHAARLASGLGRALMLVHVADHARGRAADEAVELRRLAMRDLAAEPASQGVDVDVLVEQGDAAQTLAAVSAEQSAALIVTGTRGRNPTSSALLGSVSAELVRVAARPVALVAASADDEAGR